MGLRPAVLEELRRHGIEPRPAEAPEALRERLNDAYVEDVRRLRERQRSGEIALRDYAGHAAALARRYPLLGLPVAQWHDPSS